MSARKNKTEDPGDSASAGARSGGSGGSAPPVPTVSSGDDLANSVRMYLEERGAIEKLAVEVKERRKRLGVLSKTILEIMQVRGIPVLHLAQGRDGFLAADHVPAKFRSGFTRKDIVAGIKTYFGEVEGGAEAADRLIEFLLEHRSMTRERDVLAYKPPGAYAFDN